MKPMLFALAAAGLAVAFAACGGDDDDTGADSPDSTASATESAEATAPGGSATGTAAATGTATSGSGESPSPQASATRPAPGSGNSADAIEDFRDLTARATDRTYHVAYDVTATADGEEGTGVWELNQDPPRYAAIVTYDSGDQAGTVVVINDGEKTYTCFAAGDDGQCIAGGLGEGLGPVDPDETAEELENSSNVREVDGREVAGRDARCFTYTDDESPGENLICLDEETGAMLLLDLEEVTLEATEFRESVDESVFELPFDVVG